MEELGELVGVEEALEAVAEVDLAEAVAPQVVEEACLAVVAVAETGDVAVHDEVDAVARRVAVAGPGAEPL